MVTVPHRAGNWDVRGTYSEDGDLHSEFFATLIKPGIAELYYWRSHAGGTHLRMHPVLRCGLPGLREWLLRKLWEIACHCRVPSLQRVADGGADRLAYWGGCSDFPSTQQGEGITHQGPFPDSRKSEYCSAALTSRRRLRCQHAGGRYRGARGDGCCDATRIKPFRGP